MCAKKIQTTSLLFQDIITNEVPAGPQESKFSRGYEGQYRAPKSYWALQALSGPIPLNYFLSDECRSLFKSEGDDNNIRIQLRSMKNTTRHKIGLNPARGCGGTL